MPDKSNTQSQEYPHRGSIYFKRNGQGFIASEHTASTEGRGPTPFEAIRDYLNIVEE